MTLVIDEEVMQAAWDHTWGGVGNLPWLSLTESTRDHVRRFAKRIHPSCEQHIANTVEPLLEDMRALSTLIQSLRPPTEEDTRITVPQLLWGSEAAHVARRHPECDEGR